MTTTDNDTASFLPDRERIDVARAAINDMGLIFAELFELSNRDIVEPEFATITPRLMQAVANDGRRLFSAAHAALSNELADVEALRGEVAFCAGIPAERTLSDAP